MRERSQATRGSLLVGLALGVALAACTTATDPAHVVTLAVLPALDSVEVGSSTSAFHASMKDASGSDVTGRQVTWRSANEGIATVDAQGAVHGVAAGQTTITASVDGKSANATVKVLIPVASILMVPESLSVPLTTQPRITVQLIGPAGEAIVGRAISWASADPSIATVNDQGVVTPVALGMTTITATAGTKTGVTKVVVVGEPAVLARIFPTDPVQIVRLNQTKQLAAKCYNQFGNELPGQTVVWTTSNPTVVTVDGSGLVAGLALGTGTITADCGGPRASVSMQVTLVPVATATINSSGLTMLVGQQQQLSVTAYDSAGNVLSLTGRTVNWTSDNLVVATVSQAGVVTALAAGSANIQVIFPNDGVTTAPVPVTVQNVPIGAVTISPSTVTLSRSGTNTQATLTVQLKDVNGNNVPAGSRTVTWSNSDATLVTLSATTGGLVNVSLAPGSNIGTATITATCEGVSGTATITVNP